MFNWIERVLKAGCREYAPFYEPDLDNEMTAMAVFSTPKTDELMKDMRLV